MMSSDFVSHSSSTRALYTNLFRLPSSFNFIQDEDGDKLLFTYNGILYSSYLSEFHLGVECWKRFTFEKPKTTTRSERLLQERMRQSAFSMSYDVLVKSKLILTYGPGSVPQLLNLSGDVVCTFSNGEGALGLQACPCNPLLVAGVIDGDMFLMDGRTAKLNQLTFTKDFPKLSAGLPSYIIQEEFDRYVGFLWQNDEDKDGAFRILYEEVNEEGVEVIHTFNPVSQSIEDYFYPRPGKMNAKSVLKLLVMKFDDSLQLTVEERHLSVQLSELFPHCCEYLVRFGWMPGGEAVWIQLLDRLQKHLTLAVLDVDSCFSSNDGGKLSTFPKVYILWEEKSSFWITVSDCLEFLPTEEHSQSIRFLWLSAMSGCKHLYLVEAVPPSFKSTGETFFVPLSHFTSHVITCGEWCVLGSKVWVDTESKVVYFQGNKVSPVEKHLYVVDLMEENCDPKQLTAANFYHDVTVDTINFKYFLSVFSNASTKHKVSIHSLPRSSPRISEWHCSSIPELYIPPTFFSVKSDTGEELYGAIYSPEKLEEGVKVPTIVYVYGGPCVQVVTCALSRHLPRIQSWRHHGYAVVMLDNRGSANRGIRFESFVKGCMGSLEVQDQVLGVKTASQLVDFIDLDRVGIMGWSYGGFLSLMAIAQYPGLFKVCISGAPVTDWLNYDTAYTERYLGLPHDDNDAYSKSSVLQHASDLPSGTGRVLLIHGLCDENVLFTHSASLCDKLVKLGKPHVVQFYSDERHGFRSFSSVIHCDATILQFLNQNL